jgi:hypothetical protein
MDWLGVMSITKLLLDRDGGPLDVGILREIDNPKKEPSVFQKTIDDVQRLVQHLYQRTAFHVQQMLRSRCHVRRPSMADTRHVQL